jgi:hypothetical protein
MSVQVTELSSNTTNKQKSGVVEGSTSLVELPTNTLLLLLNLQTVVLAERFRGSKRN